MKKLIVCISLLLAIAMAVVACTNDSQNENNTSASTTKNEEGTTVADEDPTTNPGETESNSETSANDETTVNEDTTAGDETTENNDVTTESKEEETTETKEPEPQLPAGCIFYVGPEELAKRVADGKANNTTAQLKDGYVTLTSTGEDPYIYLIDNNSNVELSWYFMLIVRLPSNAADKKYNIFVGNGEAPSADKSYSLTYGDDCIGKWNCLNIGIQPLIGV